ncbi:MAG TPA: trypsin-like peptidase domain-containing protein [Burkholderiales bacterium]|jgi:serine protease Do
MRPLLVLLMVFVAGAAAQPPDFTALARDAGASVVVLTGSLRAPLYPDLPLAEDEDPGDSLLRDFLRRRFGPDAPLRRSLGSGFVIDAAGYIITNAHLVADAYEVSVRLADRRELEARVVGFDLLSDIALVKVEAGALQPVRLGDPAKLRAGEWVAAIGSPFGLERSLTAGIVSALARTLPEESFVAFIQTDVAVNPGNSGGPLLNLRGEVVGVTSAFYSETGGYVGLSFAIPIDVAMDVAAKLRAHGKVTRGRIGVRLQEVSAELARALSLPRASGALVVEVFKGSAAERAALQPGDVVLRFAGKPVQSDADLVRLTAAATPGSTVEVELMRFGAPLSARLRVEEARAAVAPAREPAAERGLAGMQLAPGKGGVVVERPGEAGRRAGLARGDIILSVNGRSVPSAEVFRALLQAAGQGATVALLVQRDGERQFLPLRVPR